MSLIISAFLVTVGVGLGLGLLAIIFSMGQLGLLALLNRLEKRGPRR